MLDIIEFQDAIKATHVEDRSLLIGNGFSAKYFNYRSLLEKSGLDEGTPLRKLFPALETSDFEEVVRALENSSVVETVYGNEKHAEELKKGAEQVRNALVEAIKTTHPKHHSDLIFLYESSTAFLENFSTVFTLNYDLLLYWVNLEKHIHPDSLEKRILKDGFGLGARGPDFIGPFKENAHCSLYNLHGGLHLFNDEAGKTHKALNSGEGVISTITSIIANENRFPIFVAEGTSAQKMQKINSIAYLRHCYKNLEDNSETIFIYGHSADEKDAHIYKAIFTSKAKHIYFGIYKPNDKTLKDFDTRLNKYKNNAGSKTNYTFFDSESARVWDS